MCHMLIFTQVLISTNYHYTYLFLLVYLSLGGELRLMAVAFPVDISDIRSRA